MGTETERVREILRKSSRDLERNTEEIENKTLQRETKKEKEVESDKEKGTAKKRERECEKLERYNTALFGNKVLKNTLFFFEISFQRSFYLSSNQHVH